MSKPRVLVVSGTDTGVGKTIVTAALAALALARGERVAVVKPVQTGQDDDLETVARLSGAIELHQLSRYDEPLAPASAARRAGIAPLTAEEIADAVRALTADLVLIEGAGGLLVRFDDEEGGGTLADVAALLLAPVLVVVRAGLGTLNHTALTVEALRARRLRCAGIVIGSWPDQPDLATASNLDDLPTYAGGAPLLGRLPEGAGRLSREQFLAVAASNLEVPE